VVVTGVLMGGREATDRRAIRKVFAG
jgi:hypothetical protein